MLDSLLMGKMITRRNWLLKCSILVNVAVLLYICSHVMIGNNTSSRNFESPSGGGFLMQAPSTAQQAPQYAPQTAVEPSKPLEAEQKPSRTQEPASSVSYKFYVNYNI